MTKALEKLGEISKRNSETRLDFDKVDALSGSDHITLTSPAKTYLMIYLQIIINTPARK